MMKQTSSISEKILLSLAVLLITAGVLIYGWYGSTRLSIRQSSAIQPGEVKISSGNVSCTLEIPDGTLTIRRPKRAALGSSYPVSADVELERPLRLTGCTGGLPNWNVFLEGQTALVASNVRPYAVIRQPAFDREKLRFEWTFTPEETVPVYQSHLTLRAIVTEQDQTVERWNLLIRDFPMENTALFGQPTILWLAAGGVSLLIGALLLIWFFQKKRRRKATPKVR